MAIWDNTNTTGTIERASAVLGRKCEETEKNLSRLLKEAGCGECETKTAVLPLIPGCRDDVAFVGLNGVSFYFMRGKQVRIAEPLMEILRSCGEA